MSAILKQKLIDIANGFTKYGLWKGGINLSELDDVTLTNLQSNDVLTYNGSVWVNDDTLNSNLSKKMNSYNMNSIDDIRENYSIGLNIIRNRGYFIVNIRWIHFEIMITENDTVYRRIKYGSHNWTEWVEL